MEIASSLRALLIRKDVKLYQFVQHLMYRLRALLIRKDVKRARSFFTDRPV